MNDIIQLVTILFILSLICERVAEFTKNYFCGKKIFGLFITGDTLTKYSTNSLKEQRRHYRILKINLLIGFITAFLCHASLFDIIRSMKSPGMAIGWPDTFSLEGLGLCGDINCFFSNITFLLGCFFTGAFISLGSKFWHDLLDILLQIKNLKQQATISKNNLDFYALPVDEQVSKIQAAIELNWKRWMSTIPNVTGVGIANKLKEENGKVKTVPQKVIQFQVFQKQSPAEVDVLVPSFVDYGAYRIPTDIIEGSELEPQYIHPGDESLPRKCGSSVSRAEDKSTGTISLKVRRIEGGIMRHYLLTCAHVLMQREFAQGKKTVNGSSDLLGNPEVVCPGLDTNLRGIKLGKVAEGCLTDFTDSALVDLDEELSLDDEIHEIGDIENKTRAIDDRDVDVLQVKFCGAFSGLVEDKYVRGYGIKKKGKYPRAVSPHFLHQLILIDKCSDNGDSGAAVMDKDNRVIGIVVGSDSHNTFVIPIQSVKSAHKQFQII